MTGNEVSHLLDELYRIHRQIGDINYRVQRLKRTIVACNAAVESAKLELQKKQELKRKALATAGEREREASQIASGLDRRREQLNLAKSEREYQAIKIQIEVEESKNDSAADLALEALNAVDQAETEIEKATGGVNEAENALQRAKNAYAKALPGLQKDMERTVGRLREAESKLPRDWAGLYVRCVQQYGGQDALAPLTDQVYCGSCNCQVTPDTIVRVCSGYAVPCASCGRLLFMPIGYKTEGAE